MNLDPRPFPTPYLRRHQFHEAVANSHHKVFAIPPGACTEEIPALAKMLIDEQIYAQERILQFDESAFEIGFPTGSVNGTTVLGVFDAEAQDWLDELELEEMPTIWTPDGRYYLFDYLKPDWLNLAGCPVRGYGCSMTATGSLTPVRGSRARLSIVSSNLRGSGKSSCQVSSGMRREYGTCGKLQGRSA